MLPCCISCVCGWFLWKGANRQFSVGLLFVVPVIIHSTTLTGVYFYSSAPFVSHKRIVCTVYIYMWSAEEVCFTLNFIFVWHLNVPHVAAFPLTRGAVKHHTQQNGQTLSVASFLGGGVTVNTLTLCRNHSGHWMFFVPRAQRWLTVSNVFL